MWTREMEICLSNGCLSKGLALSQSRWTEVETARSCNRSAAVHNQDVQGSIGKGRIWAELFARAE